VLVTAVQVETQGRKSLLEGHPRHDGHVNPVLVGEQQVGDQPEAAAEGQLVDPAGGVVGVDRLAPLGTSESTSNASASAAVPAGGSARIWARAAGSMSSVYAMRKAVLTWERGRGQVRD
jgi:hypothetical protein